MSAFDVRIHAIRCRPDRRRPFEVRWHAGGRARSRSFITRGLADSYRAELIRAARQGLDFSPGTGEPASWAAPEAATISWLEHAAAYAAMKWPLAAACTRAGIADALATITPDLLTPGRGRPPAAVAPADLRVRRRWAAVPRCPRRPAQRKPLRPDLAPGPRRSHPGERDRHPAGPPPLRPAPCRAVAVAGLRRPARRDRCPRRAQRACPAHHLRPLHTRLRPDRQPAHRPGAPPCRLRRWPI